jgi:hypothetical protein
VGTSPRRTLGIVFRGRYRPLAPVGVIEAPRVQLTLMTPVKEKGICSPLGRFTKETVVKVDDE